MIPDRFIRGQAIADGLIEGYFLILRDSARRMPVPVWIRFAAPTDPDTGEEMDRSPRWQIDVAGYALDDEPLQVGDVWINDLTDFWPRCRDNRIDESDYRERIALSAWAAANDPNDAFATPGGKINPMTATLPFMEG